MKQPTEPIVVDAFVDFSATSTNTGLLPVVVLFNTGESEVLCSVTGLAPDPEGMEPEIEDQLLGLTRSEAVTLCSEASKPVPESLAS